MQLEKEELVQLLKVISLVLQEACFDFSKVSGFAVVNINGNCITINKNELNMLYRIKSIVEGDLKW